MVKAPAVKGKPKVGKTVKANEGKWAGSKTIAYAYQWKECDPSGASCTNIGGATSASYVPTPEQFGQTLRVVVTAKNGFGEQSAESEATLPILSGAQSARINLCGTLSQSKTLSPRIARTYVLTCPLDVPAGKTLTIEPGTVVKIKAGRFNGTCDEDHEWCSIGVGGTLIAKGTASNPITFTSENDNSVGGTTGNGNPQAGDWEELDVYGDASATLEHTTIEYAATALSVAEEAEATIHGRLVNDTVGVSANTYVDASEVDWGSASGPSPIGSGTPIEGEGVWVTPWVGYVAPTRPAPVSTTPATFNDCRKFLVISARGSGEAPQGNPPTYTSNEDGMGARGYNAFYGLRKRLEAYGYSDSDFKLLGLRYRALGVVFNPLNYGTEAYFESIYEGVESLESELYDQASKCPSQRAILAGYSQGALVVHLALRELAQSNPSMLSASRIAGVMLIADPAKVSHETEPVWEEANTPAPYNSGVDKADGVWTKAGLPNQGALPSAITGRTIAFCANHDIVCAPGIGSNASVHTGYYSATPMNEMGEWMAGRILGLN